MSKFREKLWHELEPIIIHVISGGVLFLAFVLGGIGILATKYLLLDCIPHRFGVEPPSEMVKKFADWCEIADLWLMSGLFYFFAFLTAFRVGKSAKKELVDSKREEVESDP